MSEKMDKIRVVKSIYIPASTSEEALDKLPAKFDFWQLRSIKKCGRKFEVKVARTYFSREVI